MGINQLISDYHRCVHAGVTKDETSADTDTGDQYPSTLIPDQAIVNMTYCQW